jgi:DNA-binding transcriptional MerR regulator
MSENEFSIQDLCDQTGLPRRTIHFYIQQEILPPPIGSGLGARYQAEHLLRLKLIPHLRQQGLKLDDIRRKFHATDRTGLEQLLAQTPASPLPLASAAAQAQLANPAQAYLAYHLAHGIIVFAPKEIAPDVRSRLERLLQSSELDR